MAYRHHNTLFTIIQRRENLQNLLEFKARPGLLLSLADSPMSIRGVVKTDLQNPDFLASEKLSCKASLNRYASIFKQLNPSGRNIHVAGHETAGPTIPLELDTSLTYHCYYLSKKARVVSVAYENLNNIFFVL